MSFRQSIKCFLGAHKQIIIAELPVMTISNVPAGINYVTKCEHCGKIKCKIAPTLINHI